MELDSKFVDLNIVGHWLGNHTLHLDADGRTKGHALGSTEGETNLIDFLVIGNDVLSHSER